MPNWSIFKKLLGNITVNLEADKIGYLSNSGLFNYTSSTLGVIYTGKKAVVAASKCMATPNPYSKVLYGTSACLSGSSCILSSICLVSGFSCVAPLPALSGVLGNIAGYAGQVSSAVGDHLATKGAAKATVDIVAKLIQ